MSIDQLSLDIEVLRRLSRKSSEKPDRINRICRLAPQHGLTEHDLAILFDLILALPQASVLSCDEKTRIIRCALVPRAVLIPPAIIMRILSQISVPQIRHTTSKRRMVQPTVQIALLRFLVLSISSFGIPGHKQLLRSLSLIFKYLSVEYARPYLVELICIALSNGDNYDSNSASRLPGPTHVPGSTRTPLKPWYIRFIVDLYAKLPTDESLAKLLIFIDTSYPKSNVHVMLRDLGMSLPRKDRERVTLVDTDRSADTLTNDTFLPPCSSEHYTRTPDPRRSSSLHSTETSQCSGNTHEVIELLELQGKQGLDPILDMDQVMSKLQDGTLAQNQMNHFCSLIPRYCAYNARSVRYLLIQDYILFLFESSSLTSLTLLAHFPALAMPHLALSMIILLMNWKSSAGLEKSMFYKICSDVFTRWWTVLVSCADNTVPLTCLILLRFMKSLDIADINRHFGDGAVVLPPPLVARLALSGDPVTQSSICGHVAFGKKYNFKLAKLKIVHNTYIMDLVNLYWRDRALQYSRNPESPHKGFFLHEELISLLANFLTFSSESFTLNSIGGVFTNPAWSVILAQIIRKLEDECPGINVRHYGPVTRESVLGISGDRGGSWLDMSYESVKRQTLEDLDRLGFTGFADLIFTSIQGFQDQRIHRS